MTCSTDTATPPEAEELQGARGAGGTESGSPLTGTLGPADEGRPRGPRAPLAGPGEQHADAVLGVGLQVPHLVGERAHAVRLGPGRLAGAVLDLPADDGPVAHDGVGVELDDQVGGAGPQQLGRSDGRGRYYV